MAYQASPTRSSSINSLSNASNANSANGSPRSVQSGGGASTVTSVSSMGGGVPQPSEEELNGRTYLEWLKSWDDTMVARWLTDNRCGSHANTFAVNDIRGNVLLDVDQQALKEMGVQSVSVLSGTLALSARSRSEQSQWTTITLSQGSDVEATIMSSADTQ